VVSIGNSPRTENEKKRVICIQRHRRRVSRGSQQLAGRRQVYPSRRGVPVNIIRVILPFHATGYNIYYYCVVISRYRFEAVESN